MVSLLLLLWAPLSSSDSKIGLVDLEVLDQNMANAIGRECMW